MKNFILSFTLILCFNAIAFSQTPIASYPFTGNANDAIGSNNGTVNGATLTTDRFGNANSAYSFDGVNNFIQMPSPTYTAYTIESSVRFSGTTADRNVVVFTQGNPFVSASHQIRTDASGHFVHYTFDGAGHALIGSTIALPNVDYHVAIVASNNGQMKLYINGVEDGTPINIGTLWASGTELRIGTGTVGIIGLNNANYFNGSIDDINVYNTALTASQVQNDYNKSLGLIASYPFSGNANDAIGTNHGTVNGATLTSDRFGNANSSYSFDGVDDFITTSNLALTQSDNFTMTAWIKPASLNQIGFIMQNGDITGNIGLGYGLALSDGSGLNGSGNVLSAYYAGNGYVNSGGTFSTANIWYHVVFVRSSGIAKFYINGTQTTNTSAAILNAPIGSLIIGGLTGGGNFNGSIDEVKIYNTALTSSQVLAEFNTSALTANYATQFNNNVQMNGTNDYMMVPHNAAFNSTAEITLEAWVYPTSFPSQYPTIIAKYNASTAYELDLKNDNTIEWECFIGGFSRSLNAGPIALNQWTHIAAIYNGTAMKIYKNGIEIGSLAVTGAIGTNSSPVEIGSRSGGGAVFAGKIDEVRIWNIARTQTQIANAMNAPLVGNETGLIGYWDINRSGQGAGLFVDNKATVTGTALNATTFGTANTPIFSSLNPQVLKPGSGNALTFDGVDDFVEMPNVLQGLTQTTIEFWVKTTENRTSGLFWQKPTLIGNANPGAPDGDFGITTNNGQIGIWSGLCTCGDQSLQTTTPINDNQWHHVAAINNGTIIQLYVDGIAIGSIPSTGGMGLQVNGRPLYLGASNSCCSGINAHAGSIDEVRFWNIALSESQLRDRMCRKITTTDALYANLVNYNNADETSGNTIFDGSSNGNHKTLQGGVARVTSGAPIGNASTYNYVTTGFPSANLSVNAQDNLAVVCTAGTYTGEAGTHIYAVNEKPNTENGITVLGSNDKYFGVFNANLTTPQYSATYNYTGNTNVITSLENFLSLYKRNDNATTIWTNSVASLNTTANTLSVTGQNTEFILGLNPSNQVLKPGSGNAISFDGVNDAVTVPYNSSLAPTSLTLETWVKINAYNSTKIGGNPIAQYMIFKPRSTGANFEGYALIFNDVTKKFRATVTSASGTQTTIESNGIIDLNKFYHVAVTANNTELKLYVNGILQSTGATGFALSYNTDPLQIGQSGYAFDGKLNGTLDEIKIWNTTLTQTQIRDRMCHKINSSDPLYSNLVAYYNFDETTGNTAFDGSVNANNGTLTNNPTRVTSGAAIGNTSTHNYVSTGLPSANLSVNAQDNLAIAYTAGTFAGEAGTHVYAVNEKPNTETGINAITANTKYFGVFNANLTTPTYSATYNYTGNPSIDGTNENSVALYKRNDNAITTWTNTIATLNSTAKTLNVIGQNTEYMLGLNVATPFSPTNVMVNDGTETFASTPNGMMQGALNFTIETWIKTTENKSNGAFFLRPTIIGNGRSSSADNDVAIFTNNGNIGMYSGLGGENVLQTAVPINNNQWHHIACVRIGTTLNLYVDGINVGNTAVGATQTLITSDAPLTIGGCAYNFGVAGINTVNISAFHQGEYAETRFSNTARYTSNFIPSNSFTSDANTVALYHYGTCQREQCVDATTNNNFLRGRFSAPTCSPVLPFNNAVTYDGINQGALLPNGVMNGLTSFTIEGWIKSSDINTSASGNLWQAPIIVSEENPAGASGDLVLVTHAGYLGMTYEGQGNGVNSDLSKYFISDNQWHHWAACADGSTVRFFVDGMVQGSRPVGGGLTIGATDKFALMTDDNLNTTVAKNHSGMLDEVRFSNTARYVTNFIPPTTIFTSDANTVALYHSDDCSNVSLYDSSSNNNHASFQNMIINCGGGIISGNQNSCTPIVPTPLTGTPAFGSEPAIVYQWQDSIVGGIWTNISGATTGASYAPPLLSSPKYYRRIATLSSVTNISNELFLDIRNAISPSIIPLNSWNLYAYDGSSLDSVGITFKGYYSRSTIGFNTVADFTTSGNPSMATGYDGCSLSAPGNQWTMHMKRQGFPTGSYVLQIPQHDDNIRIIKDGITIVNGTCCNNLGSEFYTLGLLDANTKIECRVQNGGGPGHLQIALTQQALVGGTISGNQTNCGSFIPAILNSTLYAYGGSLTTINYQWQESTDNMNFTDISGATSITYQPTIVSADKYFRRKALNANGEMAFSNSVLMHLSGPIFFADTDGDGFGDVNNTIVACTAPSGYVANSNDCNDNDPLQKPGQTWYLDMDNDGYVTNASASTPIVQCNRPLGGKLVAELIGPPYLTDCNDNNNHVHPGAQYVTYTGAPNYTNNIVYPLTGDPFTNYRYEVMYFNIYNELPEVGAPRLSVDFNQNFILDLIDKRVSMLPDDVNDLNTQDGKKYYINITGLQPGIPIQSYVSPTLINCNYFGPFTNSPQVLTSPNLSILAQDISFSNYSPSVSSPITVSATIKNESDFQATNFTVKLVNMFDTSISYPINTVAFVPAHSNTTVSWNITTPAIASLCPMKVIIDFNNNIIETNEFDNVAIRGFANGGGSAQGGISVNTQVSPSTVYILPGETGAVNLTGQAIYTGLSNPLINAQVSGADVSCTIVETGQTFTGNTDAQGNFSISITTPVGLGIYHISGTVYDFTWAGSFNATNNQFEVLDAAVVVPNNMPQLIVGLNIPVTSILVGNPITASYGVGNAGTADVTSPFKTKWIISGPNNFLLQDSVTITQLNTSSTSTVFPLISGILNTAGTYYVSLIADVDENIIESAENDNTQTIAVTVLEPTVDLVAGIASTPPVVCTNQIVVSAAIQNEGSIPSSASQAVIRLKDNGLIVDTVLIPIAAINANESFPIAHTFTPVFSQHNFTIEVVADRFNTILESSELNNVSTVQIFVDTCKPDLKMADECIALAINALNNDYTGSVTLSALITNTGDRKLQQPLTVRFDFMNGTFYDQVLNSPLDISNSITVQTTIPSLPIGATQLKVIIDPANNVLEKNETDNESGVKALGKDYSPTTSGCTASIPAYNYHVGGFFHLYSPILSNTLLKSDSLLVNFKISGPGISGIQNLGDAKLYNVNPTCVCPAVASIPSVYLISQQGLYHIYVTTDPNNDILETDETNNVLDMAILVQDKSDMVMTSSFINPSNLNPIAGQSITTQVTYENIGNENLSDSMKLKLIIDNVVVDSISKASGLIQNGKATVNFNTPWSSIQPGVHLIRSIIDADNIVDELNESNNESVRPIIVGDAANMHFASLTASHLYPSLYDSITILANIANNGALNCSSNINFYFTNNLNDTIAFKSIPVTVPGNSNVPISFKWKVLDEQTTIFAVIKNSTAQEFDYTDNDSSFQLGKMKLIFESEPACFAGNTGKLFAGILGGNAPYSYQWNTGTSSSTLQDVVGAYSVIVTDATGQTTSDTSSIVGCLATVQLTCFLQGYYLGSSSMTEALINQGRINLHTHTDTITVELRNATTYVLEHSIKGILKTDGTMKAYFPLEAIGNSYYIVIKNRNTIETWTANPVLISLVTPYDFTTSANKAYGDNQIEVEPGIFAIYSGDINQDESIDGSDVVDIENGTESSAFGYNAADLNGDGSVDGSDYPIWDANTGNSIYSIHP